MSGEDSAMPQMSSQLADAARKGSPQSLGEASLLGAHPQPSEATITADCDTGHSPEDEDSPSEEDAVASTLPQPALEIYPLQRNFLGVFKSAYNNLRNTYKANEDSNPEIGIPTKLMLDTKSAEHATTASSEKSRPLPVLPDTKSAERDATASSEKSRPLPVLPDTKSAKHATTASSEKSTPLPVLPDTKSAKHTTTASSEKSTPLPALPDTNTLTTELTTTPNAVESTAELHASNAVQNTRSLNVLSGYEAQFMAAVKNGANSAKHDKVSNPEATANGLTDLEPSSQVAETQNLESTANSLIHLEPSTQVANVNNAQSGPDDATLASLTVGWSSLAYYQKPTNNPTSQVECSLCYVAPEDAVLEAYLRSVPQIAPGDLIGFILTAEVTNEQCITDDWSRGVIAAIQTNIVQDNIACLGIKTLSDLQYHTMHSIRKRVQDLIVLGFPGSGKSTGVEMAVVDELVHAVHNDRHAASVNQREPLKMQRLDMHSGRLGQSSLEGKVAPLLLALVNTHEAMSQSLDRYKQLINRTQLRVGAIYGKTDSDENLAVAIGCDIVVATPGRVYALLLEGRISWARIRYVVLDEANKLVGMDRDDNTRLSEIACHVRSIFELPPGDLCPPLKDIEHGEEIMRIFMSSKLDNSDWLDRLRPLTRGWDDQVRLIKSPIRSPTVQALFVDLHNPGVLRVDAFARFLKERCPGKILAFVHKIAEVNKLLKSLVAAGETRQVHFIHSRLGRDGRERTNNNIEREGDCIVIACATIAYGVNLATVNGVATMEPYAEYHEWDSRIGRCGRRGATGTAYYCYDSSLTKEKTLMELHKMMFQLTGGTCKRPERYNVTR